MEPRTLTKQTIRKNCVSTQQVAISYYAILSVLHDLHLTPRELQLLAFTATRGSISSGGAKQQFIEQYGSSKASIANIQGELVKRGFLVYEGKAVKVHPSLRRKFNTLACIKLDISIVKQEENGSAEGE